MVGYKTALVTSLGALGLACLLMREPPLPSLEPDPWWGPGRRQPEEDTVRPFKIDIPKEEVADFRTRLSLPLRLTPPLERANFTYGFNSIALAKVVDYWRREYDWREREERLNAFAHYKTRLEGLDIHFLRAKASAQHPKEVKVVPLLLIHGWPGSFVEFYDLLPLLTTPQEGSSVVFEVVCPSIPGYGFSQAPVREGLGIKETGQIFLKLMKRLGFEKFYLQGGDWGSAIATEMATYYPENVMGVHLNMFGSMTAGAIAKLVLGSILPAGFLVAAKDQDKVYPLGETSRWLLSETGYAHIQATKPDTVGGALNQNPVALAAYLLEKFSTWTHKENVFLPDGGLLQEDFPISLDVLLDNVCVYWFTGSITSSMRYYAENLGSRNSAFATENNPCRVPAGLAAFPQEISYTPQSIAAHKFYDIVSYTDQEAGGHFPALERPADLARDLHRFVTAVEARQRMTPA
ncbi:epoxide hydrolase 1-like [Penaeus chinensis]|uniref:epoxide hydrolase 1-like n=1 Tax=Penaeus chinensis TaxID=139456 RepID=UPI001FB5843C|nr:epoxide hydrolase 1-like [Penaeus chinensis]XP_047479500.1 epoxide hydrolase 1-like [Penaeus chinensis]